MNKIYNSQDGFTLIEVLIAISISSIVILSFNTIILSSYQIYDRNLNSIERSQKAMVFTSWLKTKIDSSSNSYISKNDNLLTIKEKDSSYLYKLNLYESQGKPAVGIEKYQFQDNILSYIEKEPILNGVIDLKIEEINYTDHKYFFVKLTFEDNKTFNSIIY
ncbi:MAG: prepilin-type N-terminal cleavage/methylation domain-containing protein [Halanaerobiales bacterium]|nr:prepilin-type N-terminal cleavage/methylation domain-containing protein [Halanaerobiales bacterium]